ncbi:MAG TPA: polysaccharide deacetylase family protein [Bacillota bacterium]
MEDQGRMALTFDGAPNPPGTVDVLEALRRHSVKATFFMEGHRLEKEASTALRVKAEGHEIGNHSYSHPMFDEIDLDVARMEIEHTDRLLREKVGVETRWFRPPAGQLNDRVRDFIRDLGYDIALWSFSIKDWEGPGPTEVAGRVLAQARPDSICVFHDRIPWVPETLDIVIPELRRRGFRFVKVSELGRRGLVR